MWLVGQGRCTSALWSKVCRTDSRFSVGMVVNGRPVFPRRGPEGTRTRSSDKFCCVTRVSVRRWHLGSKKPSVMLACGLCVRRASVVTRFPPRSVRREGSGFHVPVLHTEGVARALDARAGA